MNNQNKENFYTHVKKYASENKYFELTKQIEEYVEDWITNKRSTRCRDVSVVKIHDYTPSINGELITVIAGGDYWKIDGDDERSASKKGFRVTFQFDEIKNEIDSLSVPDLH